MATVVRTDNLTGTYDGAKLVNLKFYVSTDATAIDNGRVVKLDSYLTTEQRETWKAVYPAATDTAVGAKLALVATPEVFYDYKKYHNLNEFTNEAGKAARGYVLEAGDTFSVTADDFTAAPAVGNLLNLTAEGKMVVNASGVFGTCIDIETTGGATYYVIRVS